MLAFRQALPKATSETPISAASFRSGVVQTFSNSSSRVNRMVSCIGSLLTEEQELTKPCARRLASRISRLVVFVRVVDKSGNLGSNLLDGVSTRASSDLVCQGGTVGQDFGLGDVMPD